MHHQTCLAHRCQLQQLSAGAAAQTCSKFGCRQTTVSCRLLGPLRMLGMHISVIDAADQAGSTPQMLPCGRYNTHGWTCAISKVAAIRLSPAAGVKRIAGGVYSEMRQVLVAFLQDVIPDAVVLMEHCHRKTLAVNDIVLALKRRGM